MSILVSYYYLQSLSNQIPLPIDLHGRRVGWLVVGHQDEDPGSVGTSSVCEGIAQSI